MMRVIASGYFVLLFAACAEIPRPPINPVVAAIQIVIDKDCGQPAIDQIASGINAWHEEASVCTSIVVRDVENDKMSWIEDGEITIYFAGAGWCKFVFDELSKDTQWIALTVMPTGDIFIPRNDKKMRQLAMHELGHAFGLEHSTNRMSVMYSFAWGGPQSITRDDARQVSTLLADYRCR